MRRSRARCPACSATWRRRASRHRSRRARCWSAMRKRAPPPPRVADPHDHDTTTTEERGEASMHDIIQELEARRAKARLGGGEKLIAAPHTKRKRTARG